MDISAKQVMELRKTSGMPMMKCKQALIEAEGDFENAMDILRKEGMKAADKKADRATAEGLIGLRLADDGRTGTIVQVLCETEPVKNTPIFVDFVERTAALAAEHAPADLEGLLALAWPGDEADTVDSALRTLIAKIGENMKVSGYRRFAVEKGSVGAYVHHDRKTGAMVALEGEGDLGEFAKDMCMHIVFSKPTVLGRDEIAADEVERELTFLRGQIAEDPKMKGKPEQAIEAIVQGRLSKNFFGGRVLTEQAWYRDGARKVSDHLKDNKATVGGFVLLEPTA